MKVFDPSAAMTSNKMLLLLLVGASALVSPITRVSGPGACASRHRAAASSARPRAVAVADGEAFDAAARAPSYLARCRVVEYIQGHVCFYTERESEKERDYIPTIARTNS